MRAVLNLEKPGRLGRLVTSTLASAALLATGCSGDDGTEAGDDRPSVVVTTTILGDIVEHVAGDAAAVEVVMPRGADPHEFEASTREAEAMAEADLLVVNGAGFEASLDGAIETAVDAGVEVFTVADHVELLGDDPHLWTDPTRLIGAVQALGDALAGLDGIGPGVEAQTLAYLEALTALDRDIEELVGAIPEERRILVTNHEVFAYFADRYGFDVVGAVVPSLTTGAAASAADLEDLATIIRDTGVPAIFAETTSSTDLADALADSVGDIEVVTLFTESLGEAGGEAGTYVDLMRTDAERIRDALA